MTLQHLRSSTLNKRPISGVMSDGQLAINTNLASPGLFFKDTNGDLVKVGPVHVGTTAPNASPAGSSGNSVGEQWLDTSSSRYVFKIWDGASWRTEDGEFVNTSGDTMTGALGIIAGTAAAPGVFFSGDTNTGIYSPGADQVAVATNGSGRLFIDASGNVGVGVAPANNAGVTELAVGTSATNPQFSGIRDGVNAFLLKSDTAGTTLFERRNLDLILGANNGEKLRITSAGLVGIGTSSPSNTAGFSQQVEIAGTLPCLTLNQNNAGFTTRKYSLAVNASGDFGIWDNTPSAYRMYINSSGNVGIGTSSVISKLHVQDAHTLAVSNQIALIENTTTGEPASLAFRAKADNGGAGNSGAVYFDAGASGITEDNKLQFTAQHQDTITPAMTLDGSGRLGIGTTNPSEQGGQKLTVRDGSIATQNNIASGNNGELRFISRPDSVNYNWAGIRAISDVNANQGVMAFFTSASNVSAESSTERMRITNVGNVLIGSTVDGVGKFGVSANTNTTVGNRVALFSSTYTGGDSPYEGIGIVKYANDNTTSNVFQVFYINAGATANGRINANGAGAAAFGSTSDVRLKENIKDIEPQLANICSLRPVEFDYIADEGGGHQIGFIAQEMEDVYPDSISEREDGMKILTGWSKTEARLVKALQEAVAKIETLEARLTAAGL